MVWRVGLDRSSDWVEEAAATLLEPGERQRLAEAAPAIRRRRIAARAALRIAIGERLGCDPASVRLTHGPRGKPVLAEPDAELEFSLSDAGDLCLIALTTAGPVGVDIERIEPFPELERIVSSRFEPREAKAIGALRGHHRLRAFYDCWVRKEACLKALGTGVGEGLDGVVVGVEEGRPEILAVDGDDPRAWDLLAVDVGPELAAAVAVRSGPALAPGRRVGAEHQVDAVELGIAQWEVRAPVGSAGLSALESR